jgi:carbonic anhydrase/acetyltransferase-like protein (isoleucine patch superfamily)
MMDRSKRNGLRRIRYQPQNEVLESRRLLTSGPWPAYISTSELNSLLHNPVGNPAVRPNTPVLPFGTPSKSATFIDPSAQIVNGYAVIVGAPSFVGPYATLNAHGGFIKIGSLSTILDNATIVANPLHPRKAPAPGVLIGDTVLVSYGAQILGPSRIGAYGSAAKLTSIGPGALIDNATIMPGAIVSALARVGPGVTVPSGFNVLPGANVTTNAQASNPALGKVAHVTSSDLSTLNSQLTANLNLANGYAQLFQGQSATGANPGVSPTVTNVFNGNLAPVLGVGPQPGSATASTPFLPPGTAPAFPTPFDGRVQANLFQFRARVAGAVTFNSRPSDVAHHLGRSNAIRADLGQTIAINSIAHTGSGVTMNVPGGGALSIGANFVAGNNATILGGTSGRAVIGDNVTIGDGAIVSGTSLGSGTTVGARAYLLNSSFPANSHIPMGAIYNNNKLVGFVQW